MANSISIVGYGWLGEPLGLYLQSKGFKVSGTCTSLEKHNYLNSLGLSSEVFSLCESSLPPLPANILSSKTCIITIPFKRQLTDPFIYTGYIEHLIKELKKGDSTSVILCSSTSIYPCKNEIVDETSAIATTDRAKCIISFDVEMAALSAIPVSLYSRTLS